MVDLYLAEENRPSVIDLSGGEPEITPEWIPWVLQELKSRGLERTTYVWSDDNLSTDFFWRYLSAEQQELVASYRNYGRVGCFKGFDGTSFGYNTGAAASGFDAQFEIMSRLVSTGMDIYVYVTFTTPEVAGIRDRVKRFLDRLQGIDFNLPLRTVPLEILVFTPVQSRLNETHRSALKAQWVVLEEWTRELERRFPVGLRSRPIGEVPLEGRR
jgi:hypothetical protein